MSNTVPVRVLHVVGRMNRGGAESFIMNIYRAIDRKKVQFDFAVHTDQEGHFDDEILQLGGRIFPHPVPTEVGVMQFASAFAETLEVHGPFAGVHSHVFYFSGILLKKAREAGVSIRIGHSHTTGDGHVTSLLRFFYRWFMRRLLLKHATTLLGCSTAAAESLFGKKHCREPRVQVLPNAVDLHLFQQSGVNRGFLRQMLSLPQTSRVIGHVGRFDHVKNHHQLLILFSHLLKTDPEAQLVLIGDGPLRSKIEALVDSLGIVENVHLLGVRNDVPLLMAGLDLLLLPSHREGLPVVLVEAQAAGIPCVVSSNITRECDVKVGLIQYVGLEEQEQVWVNAMIRGLSAARPHFGERSAALKDAGFDIHEVVARLERIYCGD